MLVGCGVLNEGMLASRSRRRDACGPGEEFAEFRRKELLKDNYSDLSAISGSIRVARRAGR